MPGFWDAMTPAYRRLPPLLPFVPTVSVDHVGQALVGGVAALTVVHGGASIVRSRLARAAARRRAAKAAAAAEQIETPAAALIGTSAEALIGMPAAPIGMPLAVTAAITGAADRAGDAAPSRPEVS
jgi:hypothetical protein